MGLTSIEWTQRTWNPVRGCSRVSKGCRNCYAERQAARFTVLRNSTGPVDGPFAGFARLTDSGPRWTGKVELVESHLTDPLHWKKPQRIFVNSMSDLFHEALLDEAIDRVFAVMAQSPQHTFQILTKRAERMLEWFSDWRRRNGVVLQKAILSPTSHPGMQWPLPNVWLGVSVEDQKTADERVPLLLQTPAAVRFVSYEPALGPVDFSRWLQKSLQICERCGGSLSLDDEVRENSAEDRNGVSRSVDLPAGDGLPAMPLNASVVPAHVASNSGEPVHQRAVSAVDRDAYAVGVTGPSSPVKISLAVKNSGQVSNLGLGSRQRDSSIMQGRSGAPKSYASGKQSSIHGSASDSSGFRNGADGAPVAVHVCHCGRRHIPHCTIDWLICGGESGPGARPFDIAWARNTIAQCKAAGVTCFVKQLGANPQEIAYVHDSTEQERSTWMRDGWTWIHEDTGSHWRKYLRFRDRKGGDWSEWPADLRVRQFPGTANETHEAHS